MVQEVLRVGVLGRSWPPATRWGERTLRPFAVVTDLPALPHGALIGSIDGVETRWLGDHAVVLHDGETGHYRDNLSAQRPSVWVALDGDQVVVVTLDPYEGEGLAGDPERIVEAVEMPGNLRATVEAFVARWHEEIPFKKRKRTPAGPDAAAAPAPRILPEAEKWQNRTGRK